MILQVREKLIEKPQNGKNPMKRENNLWNQDKMKKGLRELKRRKKKKQWRKGLQKIEKYAWKPVLTEKLKGQET